MTDKIERPQLMFTKEDLADVLPGHQDGLVITGTLVNCRVKRIFIDSGSSADIIIMDAFKRMSLDQEDLKPCQTTLVGFNGELSPPKGYIDLRLTLGTKEGLKSERKIKMIGNSNQVVTVKGDQKESRQCYNEIINVKARSGKTDPEHKKIQEPINMIDLDLREEKGTPRPEPEGEVEDFVLGNNPNHSTKVGRALTPTAIEDRRVFGQQSRRFYMERGRRTGIDPNSLS
ncbi:hypothetical protein K1719_029886 [Acacia pycnantha]|nr:hypothetical protein K1719_029886 [Acacia pycnantha]